MGFEEQVKKLIESFYIGADVNVDFSYGAEKLNGYMLWAEFDGLEMLDRQKNLYNYLRSRLGPEAQRISIIFTYTPDEFKLMNAA